MKIIIAEDDDDFREAMTERLEMRGHKVHAVSSGAELITQLKRGHYELIVTDNNMEVSDSGLIALQRIRSSAEWNSLPVIMYSSDTVAKLQAEKLGAIFVHKLQEGTLGLVSAVEHLGTKH